MTNYPLLDLIIGSIFLLGLTEIILALWKPNKNNYNGPRPYSFVRFKFETMNEEIQSYYSHFQLEKNQTLIFISEIANMPGHCIVTKITRNKDSSESVRTYTGYHTSDFVELTDEEI